jgi:hypothetical protein
VGTAEWRPWARATATCTAETVTSVLCTVCACLRREGARRVADELVRLVADEDLVACHQSAATLLEFLLLYHAGLYSAPELLRVLQTVRLTGGAWLAERPGLLAVPAIDDAAAEVVARRAADRVLADQRARCDRDCDHPDSVPKQAVDALALACAISRSLHAPAARRLLLRIFPVYSDHQRDRLLAQVLPDSKPM